MNPPLRAPLGAALAMLLAVASLAGAASTAVVAVLVVLLAVLIAAGWPDLLELPSPGGTRIVVAAIGALGALVAVLSPADVGSMEGVAMVCAVGIFAAFGQQMVRADRTDLAASLTGTVAGVMLAGMAACWIPGQQGAATGASRAPGEIAVMSAGILPAAALGLAGALLILPLPWRAVVRAPLAILVDAGITGAVLAALSPAPGSLLLGALVGVLVAAGACAAHLLLGTALVAREPLPSLTVAAAPVATAGVVVLLAERLLG